VLEKVVKSLPQSWDVKCRLLGLGVTGSGSDSDSDSHRLQVMQKKCHHDGVKSFQHHCSLGQFTLVQNWHRLVIELLVIHHQSRLALLDDFLAVAALGRRDGCFDSESDVFPSLAATFPSLEQPLTPFCCCAVTLSNLAS
jgi:hypothetical protein